MKRMPNLTACKTRASGQPCRSGKKIAIASSSRTKSQLGSTNLILNAGASNGVSSRSDRVHSTRKFIRFEHCTRKQIDAACSRI